MSKLWIIAISALALFATSPLTGQTSTPGANRPTTTKPPAAATPQPAAALIDINSATKDELQALKGVGDVRADAIIKGRPYKTPHDLVEKKVLPENVFDGIKDKIAANQAAASAPATAAKTTGAAPPKTSTTTATPAGEFKTEADAKRHCPSDLVVWANTESKIYHYGGSTDYGKTKQGAYMCQKDGDAAGYRAARNEKPPAKN